MKLTPQIFSLFRRAEPTTAEDDVFGQRLQVMVAPKKMGLREVQAAMRQQKPSVFKTPRSRQAV